MRLPPVPCGLMPLSNQCHARCLRGPQRRLDGYLKSFCLVDGQQGLLVALGDKVAGVDLLSSPAAFARLFPKLVKSYAMDALSRGSAKTVAPVGSEVAREFLIGHRSVSQHRIRPGVLARTCALRAVRWSGRLWSLTITWCTWRCSVVRHAHGTTTAQWPVGRAVAGTTARFAWGGVPGLRPGGVFSRR